MTGFFMLCLLAFIWVLTNRYRGLTQDGELYAMQALSRLLPALRGDLYLANTSQDQFTVFSPLYAFLIRRIGLWEAGVALFAVCRVVFLAGTWCLIRRLLDPAKAWLSVILLTVSVGSYGAYGAFRFAENFLTARSMAEALVVLAIALEVNGRRVLAWAVVAIAFAIHPLMTLPGVLFLICLVLQPCRAAGLAAVALTIAAGAALGIAHLHLGGALEVVDGQWLEVIRQRSQFLFLQEWRWYDWTIHLRSILCLALIYLVFEDSRIRQVCLAAGVVGSSGLLLAWIAGSVGPIAILLQSQPWRWFWVTSFVSIALTGPLLAVLWSHNGAGRTCAALIAISWVFPVTDGMIMAAAALIVWLCRNQIRPPSQRVIGIAGYLIIAAVAAWTVNEVVSSLPAPIAENVDRSILLSAVRAAMQVPPLALFLLLAGTWWLCHRPARYALLVASVAISALTVAALPGTFVQRGGYGTPAQIAAFSDWREAIPRDSTVLPIPTTVGAMFAWFTLERASYLSLDQSSGVVFSRATAAEVARRSEVLRPVTEPDWEIKRRIDLRIKQEDDRHPFSEATLLLICADPALGFVISADDLRLPSLLHSAPGLYNGWRLYDCRRLRESIG